MRCIGSGAHRKYGLSRRAHELDSAPGRGASRRKDWRTRRLKRPKQPYLQDVLSAWGRSVEPPDRHRRVVRVMTGWEHAAVPARGMCGAPDKPLPKLRAPFTARLFHSGYEKSPHLPELRLAGKRLRRRVLDLRSGARPATRSGSADGTAAPSFGTACPSPTPRACSGRVSSPVAARMAKEKATEMDGRRLTTWIDWYRFARRDLEYTHGEAVLYANVRFVEEQNRAGAVGPRAD